MGLDVIISELFSLLFSLSFFYLVVAIIVIKFSVKFIRNLVWKFRISKYPKDVVVLHQFPKGYQIPSMSPFALKLETWLRMTQIKYQNSFGYTFGPKGKIPFITYNGEDVPDSQFCIEYLSKKMNKDMSKDHAPKDLGVARAFSKMAEESIFWMSGFSRFVYEPNPKYLGMHPAIVWYLARAYKKRGKVQGYVYSIGKKDLKALNEFLAGKKFLIGEKPCNEDASIFGIVAQIVYTDSGSINAFIKNECPNVLEYIENIKRTYWPDWDECIGRKKNKKSE